jgi:lysozyme family protein
MAMEHHWLPGDMADIAAKVLVFVAFAALEWLLFVYRTRSGRHIQDIINDYAGTDIIRRDGFVGPETVNAARKLLPPRDL